MLSVRARLAVVVAGVTAVVAVLGGWLFALVLGRGLDRAVANELRAYSAVLVARSSALVLLPEPGEPDRRPTVAGEVMAQVVDGQGRVVEATGLAPLTPVLNRQALDAARRGPVWRDLAIGEDVDVRVLAVPVRRPETTLVAVVGTSIEDQGNLTENLVKLLVASGTLLVLVAGVGTWWLAGAALKPVERLRRQVAGYTGGPDEARIEVPATGDELAALAGTLNALLGRLHRAVARERALVADAGHELRTPLAVLQGELELAGRPGRSTDELRAAVAAAAEETDRLARLADSLLFLAADGRPSTPRRVDLGALATEAAARPRRPGPAAQVRVDASGPPGGLAVQGEPESLRRAVENLLDNALDHAPAGTEVVVKVSRKGDGVLVEVLDEGPGFPDWFLPFAFERFRRADEARNRARGGAGLGLPIVRAVAEAHGGSATVANRAGGGAVARIVLPAAPM